MGNKISSHERSHQQAKQRNARQSFSVGDDIDVVIEEDPTMNNGKQAVTHVGNLVVFVHPGEFSLAVGSHIRVRVTHVAQNYLRAVAVDRADI